MIVSQKLHKRSEDKNKIRSFYFKFTFLARLKLLVAREKKPLVPREDTLQSTKFTPLLSHLVELCIRAEFLDTKLAEKSNLTPEGVPTKAGVPSKICNYGNYG